MILRRDYQVCLGIGDFCSFIEVVVSLVLFLVLSCCYIHNALFSLKRKSVEMCESIRTTSFFEFHDRNLDISRLKYVLMTLLIILAFLWFLSLF